MYWKQELKADLKQFQLPCTIIFRLRTDSFWWACVNTVKSAVYAFHLAQAREWLTLRQLYSYFS